MHSRDDDPSRLTRQLQFLIEADKLKHIARNTLLTDASRLENDAEHSWHMALAAMVLAEYANVPDVDLLKVIKMATIHDLIEIDAGDTFAYDDAGHLAKAEREAKAADRIFGLLPEDLAEELRALWDEFEERATAEARFAVALDRFMPILHNYLTAGRQWRKHNITSQRVLARNKQHLVDGSQALADYVAGIIEDGVNKGYLPR